MLLVAAAKMPLEEAKLEEGTWQNLSNLLFLDIHDLSIRGEEEEEEGGYERVGTGLCDN